MHLLSKDQILESSDLKSEQVEVPEWDGAVLVRTMTGADRDAFESSLVPVGADGVRVSDLTNMRAKLVAMTVIDESGCRMFAETDVEALSRKSAAAIDRVYQVAQRLNALGAKAEEVAVKNSEASPSDASTSA